MDAPAGAGAVMRRIPGTDIAIHPLAVDGGVFGWASGVEETARILDVFSGAGGNLVSTADRYAGGRSEIMIGSWLKGLPDRGRAVIATKVGRHPDAPGLSARNMVRAVEASLRRFETEYIDLLSLDGVDTTTPIDETLEAVDMLRRAGKVRCLLASGYEAARIREINELAAAAAYPPIRAVSSVYNLMQRADFERQLGSLVGERGLGVLVRHPLASGFLSGDFRSKDDEPSSPLFAEARVHLGRRGSRVLRALEVVAEEKQEILGRVALAWVLSKPGVVAAGIRVKSADQLAGLFGDGEPLLTRHQVSSLDKASEF